MFLDNTISALEDALFTGASEKGTWVRLFQPPVEGKLIQGFEGLDVGDRVRVELIGTM
jgi:exoribonuclease-2